tara:strand:+ start:3891 stop:5462 length:1572 start_codon:yes stop_codon:yes gene_type:complete
MAIKRYFADKNNTITTAFGRDLLTRGTGSNMGLADSLEVFSIYAQATSSSYEEARILIQFPITSSVVAGVTTILDDRDAGLIPASGSVDFYLRVYNVATDQPLARNFTLVASPLSQSWQEGSGVDLDGYTDLTYDGTGSNWMNAKAHTYWTNNSARTLTQSTDGGSYLSASWMGSPITDYNEFNYSQTFGPQGTGDLELKITGLVEQWIKGTSASGYGNYGVGLMLTSSEANAAKSYYTKRFSARESEYFFSRPVIEARWDSSIKDNRGNFTVSSSALNSSDNLNVLYLYNYVNGQPTNLNKVGTDPINVRIYTSGSGGELVDAVGSGTFEYKAAITGGWVSTGVYSASFALDTSASLVSDRWFTGSSYGAGIDTAGTIIYYTGSFKPTKFDSLGNYYISRVVTTLTNLASSYNRGDKTRLRLFTRLKDWSPTIYTVSSTQIQNHFIDSAYYKIYRVIDDKVVVAYGTGSLNQTKLSYDVSGSYFDLDTSLLEAGYSYGIKFIYYINGAYEQQPETFKFRVDG